MAEQNVFTNEMDESNEYTETYSGETASPPVDKKDAESKLWEWMENLAVESDRVRREEARFDQFDEWLDLFYGKHWPTTLPSFRPPVVVNELRTLILSEASDLSDSNLRLYILKDPTKGGRDEEAERALRAIMHREQLDLKLIYAACWALIVGTGFIRVGWDPDASHGMGDVVIDVIDPRYVLPDPDAIDDDKWAYVMTEMVLDIQEIRRLFPVMGMQVKPEDRWSVRDHSNENPNTVTWANYVGPLSTDNSIVGKGTLGYKKSRARVLDLMIRDDKTEEVADEMKGPDGKPVLDEDGKPKMEVTSKAKYPHGRRIVGANGVILLDGPNPNPNGDFGILRVILEPALGSFWSRGFCQQTGELQMAADKLESAVVENAIRLNNGIVKATTNTGLDLESFSGIPAQIVQINPGSTFEIMYPPPMPKDMIDAPNNMLNMQRRILGFPDGRSGNASQGGGNRSAELTETDISQAQSPTRLRSKLMYYTVQRLVEMIFARMVWGYATERTIPSVEGEKFKPIVWKPVEDPSKYYVYVDPASFQIMSRTMLKRLGLALYRLKAIDRTSLLETIGWPDWEQTAKRLDQAEAAAAQAKMASKSKGGSKG